MSTIEKKVCDACGVEIVLARAGDWPARVCVYAATPADVGTAHDEHELCSVCWDKLCGTFPKFKDAERLVKPSPAPFPSKELPAEMDTWTPEQVLMALAKKLGVNILQTPDGAPPKKE
jgi:hypothetical protein